jgi:endogenous inhibitor of DNA gyrase (YacG/DUF329 family)
MGAANENEPKPFGTCPTCGKPAQEKTRPFCSRRCADVDLSRWLKGSYAIPGSGAGEDDESPSSEANSSENNALQDRRKGMDRE